MPKPTRRKPPPPPPTLPPTPQLPPSDSPPGLATCPACRRPVSPKAAACLGCGHPLAAPKPWAEVKSASRYVFLVVCLLALGGQAVVAKLRQGKLVGFEDVLPVFAQTAPLTVAVAVVGLAALRRWVEGMGLLLLAAAALTGSTIVGSQLGREMYRPADGGGVVDMVSGPLKFYLHQYGPFVFASAAILGGFFAWAGNKLWPTTAGPANPPSPPPPPAVP